MSFAFRWLFSTEVRRAVQISQHVGNLLKAQQDLLPAESVRAVRESRNELKAALAAGENGRIRDLAESLARTAERFLRPHQYPLIRENLEVALVAAVIVLGVRAFFLQPMAIPTGSAQPTLYGVVYQDLRNRPEVKLPKGAKAWWKRWVHGESYYEIQAKNSGQFSILDAKPRTIFPMVSFQRFSIGSRVHKIWFPPTDLWKRIRIPEGHHFAAGEYVFRAKVTAGDHLFVNRLSYNFSRPQRGDTIVFRSSGIEALTQGTHYIKRLVGLGGETIRISDDRHVWVGDQRLDASDQGFEFVYSFRNESPQPDIYSGHANGRTGNQIVAPLFPAESSRFRVREHHYFVLGDNTMNSKDSRSWGDFPREKVIGKPAFVFWPISDRFGWHVR